MLKIKSEIKQNVDKDVEENYDEYFRMDKDIKEEIRAHLDINDLWLTPEQMKKNKYPDARCSICEQTGCDIKVSYGTMSQMYHKRCFKLFQKKALKYAMKRKK